MLTVKLIVFDLDGTIVSDTRDAKNIISPLIINAIHLAQACGIKIAVATGRDLKAATKPAEMINADYLIASNGALLYNCKEKKIIWAHYLKENVIKLILDNVDMEENWPRVHTPGEVYLAECDREVAAMYAEIYGDQCYYVEERSQLARDAIMLGIVGDIEPVITKINNRFGNLVSVCQGGHDCIDVIAPGINKAWAVQKVAEMIGATPAQVVAYGDGLNDIEMLSWAATGIAISDAHPRVIKAAKGRTCPPGSGVGESLVELLAT